MVKKLLIKMKYNNSFNDEELVEGVKKHSEKAFSIIVKRYWDDIRNHLMYKTGNNQFFKNSIEDVVNDTFMTLYENIKKDKYETRGVLKAYLQRVAYFKLLRVISKESKEKPFDENNSNNQISDDDNHTELLTILEGDSINYLNIAEEALKILSEICFQVIILKYYEKMNDEEIFNNFPDELKSVRNVRKRRSHCMESLRKESKKQLKSISI